MHPKVDRCEAVILGEQRICSPAACSYHRPIANAAQKRKPLPAAPLNSEPRAKNHQAIYLGVYGKHPTQPTRTATCPAKPGQRLAHATRYGEGGPHHALGQPFRYRLGWRSGTMRGPLPASARRRGAASGHALSSAQGLSRNGFTGSACAARA